MYCLFGNDFNKIENNLITSTNKTFLLHVVYSERAKEIFDIADLCVAKVYDNNNNNLNNNNNKIRYPCCGKVIIMNGDTGTDIIGYILKETTTYWTAQLANNSTNRMLVPTYIDNAWIFLNQMINDVPYTVWTLI